MLKAQLTSESQPKIIQLFYIHTKKKTRKRLMKLSFYFSRWSSKSSFYLSASAKIHFAQVDELISVPWKA